MTTLSEFEDFNVLQQDFLRWGYALQLEPGDNPYVVVKTEPKRMIIWRTRTRHVLHAILRTIKAERGGL